MLNDITIGQYFPGNSIIHKTDPRAKLVLLFIIIILIFVSNNPFSIAFMALTTVSLLLASKVPVKIYFKNLKSIFLILLITAILNIFYIDTGTVLFDRWIFTITSGGIERAVLMIMRIVLLILSSAMLTYTTTPTALTDAIERLLSPLKYVKLETAVHTMAMMMTIALRFIPTLIEETQKIMSAQKARGADMESGNLMQRIKALLPILIPLLISSFRRAYDLAEAMECRCYNGGKGRKRMKQLKLSAIDYISAVFVLIIFACVVLLNIFF